MPDMKKLKRITFVSVLMSTLSYPMEMTLFRKT